MSFGGRRVRHERPCRMAYTTACARSRRRAEVCSVFEEAHQLRFGQRVEVQLEADHRRRRVGIDLQPFDAYREDGEDVAMRSLALRLPRAPPPPPPAALANVPRP